jgi:putative oxidoreductase
VSGALAALGPLLGRLMMAALFLYSGYGKFVAMGRTAAAVAGHGLPYATAGAYVAAFAEVLGGLALALGVKTRAVALLFVVYLVAVTYVFHWHPALRGDHQQLLNVLKNASIAGGLFLLATHGPGPASVDRG